MPQSSHSAIRWTRRRYRAVMEMVDEAAQLAKECAIIRQAVALAGWVGTGGEGPDQVRSPA